MASPPFKDFWIFAVSSCYNLFTWAKGLIEVLKRKLTLHVDLDGVLSLEIDFESANP